MRPVDTITIQGFKSILNLPELKLGSLNIMIGANGSGKSNFIQFFRMLENMSRGTLRGFIEGYGGAQTFLYNGPKRQNNITCTLTFGQNAYSFELAPSVSDELLVMNESPEDLVVVKEKSVAPGGLPREYTGGRQEARLYDWGGAGGRSWGDGPRNVCGYIHEAISSWRVYHFHDTSENSLLRAPSLNSGDLRLLQNGANLAPFLYYLQQKHTVVYKRIVETIQVIAPFFVNFSLEPDQFGPEGKEKYWLRWRQKGAEQIMQPWQLSDGTLRFIALTVALMQPMPPSTILIDEPELGLHPRALSVLRGLLHEASQRMQIIVTTQSPSLLNSMEPENIIIVGREGGASTFHRLERVGLAEWLDEYTMEDLWRKNVIQAGPDYE